MFRNVVLPLGLVALLVASPAMADKPTLATTARPIELSAALRTSVTQRSYFQKASPKVEFKDLAAYVLGTGEHAVCGKVTRNDGFDLFFVRFSLATGRYAHRETLYGYHAFLACRSAPEGTILLAAR